MKKCFKCKISKNLNEFYIHKQMKDGHLNKCKECAKRDSTKHRLLNIEKIRAYDRYRGNRQKPTYMSDYRKKYPKKYSAHCKVNNAIRDNKLKKIDICEECQSKYHVVAHHDDYNKPLSVRWLCQSCHRQWHMRFGEGKNAS